MQTVTSDGTVVKITGSLVKPHIMYAGGYWHVRIPVAGMFLFAHEDTFAIAVEVAAKRRPPTRRYGLCVPVDVVIGGTVVEPGKK